MKLILISIICVQFCVCQGQFFDPRLYWNWNWSLYGLYRGDLMTSPSMSMTVAAPVRVTSPEVDPVASSSRNLLAWVVKDKKSRNVKLDHMTISTPAQKLYDMVQEVMEGGSDVPLSRIINLSQKVTNQLTNEVTPDFKGHKHPCLRPCYDDPSTRMTCGYNFTVANYLTLSPHCLNCPNVTRDCFIPGCLPAHGLQMPVTVVNKLMPGPPIRVCQGDTIVVDVHNKLSGQETAIHWHGIHQRSSPWMDGVPHLTQCGISPGSTFRYEFDTPTSGTYFWHSHAGLQRADGVFGPLIVRRPSRDDDLYDFDLPEHEILIWDIFGDLALSSNIRGHIRDQRELPQHILINGRGLPNGFFTNFQPYETLQTTAKTFVALHEIWIQKGYSYRMRVISNGVTLCPVELSVQGHGLQVIASDGFDLVPITVESLVLQAGERFDFILRGDQPIGSYWIKVRGLLDCETNGLFQLAVLNYEGVPEGTLPPQIIQRWADAAPSNFGVQLNPVNMAPGVLGRTITVAEMSSDYDDDPQIILQDYADHQFYIQFDFKPIENVNFFGKGQRQFPSFRKGRQNVVHYLPQFNYISHIMPVSPPLTQRETIGQMNACNLESKIREGVDCIKKHCRCTHLLKVALNSVVEIVLVDRGFRFDASHPFHLHGHSFRVVALEKLGNNTEAETIQRMDAQGLIRRRRYNAPIKDTVYVPDGGYTILRFRANNPGFWFFHCHIEFHQERGMALVFQVGTPSQMPQAPYNFPKCQSYTPPVRNQPMETL